jgi:hypothetical protein
MGTRCTATVKRASTIREAIEATTRVETGKEIIWVEAIFQRLMYILVGTLTFTIISQTTSSMKAKVVKLISNTLISMEWEETSITINSSVVTDIIITDMTMAIAAITTIILIDKVTTVKAEEETA